MKVEFVLKRFISLARDVTIRTLYNINGSVAPVRETSRSIMRLMTHKSEARVLNTLSKTEIMMSTSLFGQISQTMRGRINYFRRSKSRENSKVEQLTSGPRTS